MFGAVVSGLPRMRTSAQEKNASLSHDGQYVLQAPLAPETKKPKSGWKMKTFRGQQTKCAYLTSRAIERFCMLGLIMLATVIWVERLLTSVLESANTYAGLASRFNLNPLNSS